MSTARAPGAPPGIPTPDPPFPAPVLPAPTGGLPEVDVPWWDQLWLSPVLAAAAVLLALAFVLGWMWGRRGRRRTPRPPSWPGPRAREPGSGSETTVPASPAGGGPALDAAALAEGLITLHDLTDDDAERQRIERLLRRGGVERIPVEPGAAFDDGRHHVVSTTSGSSGPAGLMVHGVARPGWQAGARVLRPAEVSVREPEDPVSGPGDPVPEDRR